ncbi:MAG: LuxR family transcriptional regulator [Pseudomonadota bacterium]
MKPVADLRAGELTRQSGIWIRGGRSIGALSYTAEWIQRYFDEGYEAVDPVRQAAGEQFAPIDWNVLDWSKAPQKRFFEDAYDHGIGNQGFTVPVRGPNGQFALFSVTKSCRDEIWAKLITSYAKDFMLLAHYMHQQALALAEREAAAPTLRPLSGRERDALLLLADGSSRSQAADFLGISESTLRVYIDSARHKLGALNIPHAIAIAAHKGIIVPQ